MVIAFSILLGVCLLLLGLCAFLICVLREEDRRHRAVEVPPVVWDWKKGEPVEEGDGDAV